MPRPNDLRVPGTNQPADDGQHSKTGRNASARAGFRPSQTSLTARIRLRDQLDEVTDEHKRGPVPPNPFASRRGRRQKLYYPEPASRTRHLGSQGDDEVARLFDVLPDLD